MAYGDTISRQAAIDDIRTMNPKDAQLDIKWVEMWLKQLPPVTPKQRTGHWINKFWHGENIRECSVCHVTQSLTVFEGKVMFKFCPYCGAKMEGVAE